MKLEGKVVDFLGDSITQGVGVTDQYNRYDQILLRECNLKAVFNYGISGTRFAHQKKVSDPPRFDLSFCGRAYDLEPSADVIVVYGATNDYGHGDAPFGEDSDSTPATFCGAVEFLMNLLKTTYPEAQIVFMTPAHREGDQNVSQHPYKESGAKTLDAYVNVIKAKGKAHNIAVLDLFENLGINPNNTKDKEMYAPDGLHFNDEGQKVLAKCLKTFLEAL